MAIMRTDMNIFWVIVSMLIGVLSHVFRALRWQLQLRALDITPSFSTLCNAIFGTYAFNLILPRFGELWRCTYIANHEKKSFSRTFGSVISDRVADTLTVAIISLIVFFSQMGVIKSFLSQNPQLGTQINQIVTSPLTYIAAVAAIAVITLFIKYRSNNRFVKRAQESISKMWEGFKSVLSMKEGKILFFIYTISIWCCYFLQLYICIFAFDWMSHTTVMQTLVLFVLGSIGMAVPVQGGIGPWHAAVIFGMTFYGFSNEQAGVFALVAHGSQMIVTILLGIYTTIAILIERQRKTNLNN